MPNYGLVINSEYNPMSFDEYVKPFLEYAKVYNQMADAYDSMELEAGKWEKLANSAKDAELYALYKKYADDLRAAAFDLADNGLSVKTRGSVSNLRKRYSNEIQPISEAWDYRTKMIEEQRKLNPIGDIQFNIDFTDVGLGEIMQNPTLSYAPGRSLSAIEKAGYEAAVAASARATSKKLKDKGLGNNYYKITQGYTDADIQGFLKELETGEFDKYKELGELYNLIRSSYGTNTEDSIYSSLQNTVADLRLLQGFLKGLTKQESYQAVPRYVGGGGGGRSGGSGGSSSGRTRYAAYYTVVNPNNPSETKKIFIDTYNNKLSESVPTGWKFVNAKGEQVDNMTDAIINNIWATKFGSNYMLYDDYGIPITDKNNLPIMFNSNQRYDYISETIKHNNNITAPTTYVWDSNNSKWLSFEEDNKSYNGRIVNANALGSTSGLITSGEQYINEVLGGQKESLPMILRDPMVFENNNVYVHRDSTTKKTYIRMVPKTEGYNYSGIEGLPTSINTGLQL